MCKISTFQRNISTIFLKILNIYLFSKIFQKVKIVMLRWNILQYLTKMLRQYISIAIKYRKYSWHFSAIFCAMWGINFVNAKNDYSYALGKYEKAFIICRIFVTIKRDKFSNLIQNISWAIKIKGLTTASRIYTMAEKFLWNFSLNLAAFSERRQKIFESNFEKKKQMNSEQFRKHAEFSLNYSGFSVHEVWKFPKFKVPSHGCKKNANALRFRWVIASAKNVPSLARTHLKRHEKITGNY